MFVCSFESGLQDLARTWCCCKSSAGWRPGAAPLWDRQKAYLFTPHLVLRPMPFQDLQTPNTQEYLRDPEDPYKVQCRAQFGSKKSYHLIWGLKSSVLGDCFLEVLLELYKCSQVSDETRTLGLVVARGTSEDPSALAAFWHLGRKTFKTASCFAILQLSQDKSWQVFVKSLRSCWFVLWMARRRLPILLQVPRQGSRAWNYVHLSLSPSLSLSLSILYNYISIQFCRLHRYLL